MTRILLRGCAGRMGRMIAELSKQSGDVTVAAGVDITPFEADFPVFTDLSECDVPADVLVDFTRADGIEASADYACRKGMALLIGTTGLSDTQRELLRKASEMIPVFLASNLSMGVALMARLCRDAASFLGDGYDAEITETHHNQKLDAPSGTALTLAEAVRSGFGTEAPYVYGRQGRAPRHPGEIGIHALRGGTVAGIHEVHFFGHDETVTLTHEAQSRGVFAAGALRVASFLAGKPAGWYSMSDVVSGGENGRTVTEETGSVVISDSPVASSFQQYGKDGWTVFLPESDEGRNAVLIRIEDPALDETAAAAVLTDLSCKGISFLLAQAEKGRVLLAVDPFERDTVMSFLS